MKVEGNLEIFPLIHKLKDGISILELRKWVSPSGFHLSVAGFVGVCSLIIAAREGKFGNFDIWAEDDGDLEKWVVPGLRNLGNNCFLNVILQALASCSCLREFIEATVEECESLLGEKWVDTLPLTAALASLMEDLCNIYHKRVVLDPRKLMNVMDRYISNFNLASQQDAEEALFHLLSSLREEVSSISAPVFSSLADAKCIDNRRVVVPKRKLEQTEQERWEKHFIGPFNGIIGSSLTCESCSFQISLDFQFFHSLHISPVLCSGANVIMPGCSLADCLKHFFAAEQLENYCCGNCWHIAAIKYLSIRDGNEIEIERIRHCREQDSCDCKRLPSVEAMRWSNSFSRTFKKLSIARSPKILCIHLQRVSVNAFGELVKLQGHISFPLVLRLYPFMKNFTGAKNPEESLQTVQASQQLRHQFHTNHFPMQLHTNVLDAVYGQNFYGPKISHSGDCLHNERGDSSTLSNNKAEDSCGSAASSERYDMYQLVSVVEHFGRSGSGHYTIYRRALVENNGDENPIRWFCISDSYTRSVSEREVLAAEASLLFYEKVSENTESS